MKIRKTNTAKRETYTYTFTGADGNEERLILRPGENGVTEADIKMLHSLDDSEVYYNLKNIRPEKTTEEKAAVNAWKEEYIKKETAYSGYAPTDDEVEDAVREQFPRNYNLSFDYDFGENDAESDSDTAFDKSQLMYQAALTVEAEESNETYRVHELMNEMTDKQREVLVLTEFEGYSLTEVSKRIGISIKNVKKHHDNAMNYIKENFFK